MTRLVYGRPPAVFDPEPGAVQVSPLIPGSQDLDGFAPASVEAITVLAPAGALERRHVLAQALRALRPGGRLDVMAPKDRGGQRLAKELRSLGVEPVESAKAHHRRCIVDRPDQLPSLEAVLAEGAIRLDPGLGLFTQPGVFSWDRRDPGTDRLIDSLPELKGQGADLGCGLGLLALRVLKDQAVTRLDLIDIDRRAIDCARRNVSDARAQIRWADVRTLPDLAELDFVVMNPPFHDTGTESRGLGQAFIRRAAQALRRGGRLHLVANRHLPYEAVLAETFSRFDSREAPGGFKLIEAVR